MTIETHVPLAPFTTFGIGGPADILIHVTSSSDLINAIQYALFQGKKFFILGTGANILIGDQGFRGVVIKNNADAITVDGLTLTAESGASIEQLITRTSDIGLSGFEHFAGIPSSVGGALWQNLHFLSPDRDRTVYISQILQTAQIFQTTKEKIVGKDYFQFGYDYSVLHDNNDIVLSATFQLMRKPTDEIKRTIVSNLAWRREKHPADAVKTSAGSIFKKIEGYGAGRLIEKVGLKGHIIGGAQISTKHANFIINRGTATSADVHALIELVQQRVKKDLQLQLVPEISFIGER